MTSCVTMNVRDDMETNESNMEDQKGDEEEKWKPLP